MTLKDLGNGKTRLAYSYQANVGGKVAAVGQRMLGTVTRLLIGQFFRGFDRRLTSGGGTSGASGTLGLFRRIFGGGA